MINLKGKSVVIVGAGSNVKKYWNTIEEYIKNNKVIIIGCNNIVDIVTPDIHFWGSTKRYRKYGKSTSKRSKVVFQSNFPKKTIKKYWKGEYEFYYINPRLWKYGSDDKNSYLYKRCCMKEKKGVMQGCFCSAGSKAIFWSYIKKVKDIMIVGMDGYTFYSKKYLEEGKVSQHFYGNGITNGFTYEYNRKIDWDIYKTLRLLYKYGKRKYGFGFKIITPTIYEEFYNPNVLNIDRDPNMQKWVEPNKKEYKKLYFESKENRQLPGDKFSDYNG